MFILGSDDLYPAEGQRCCCDCFARRLFLPVETIFYLQLFTMVTKAFDQNYKLMCVTADLTVVSLGVWCLSINANRGVCQRKLRKPHTHTQKGSHHVLPVILMPFSLTPTES